MHNHPCAQIVIPDRKPDFVQWNYSQWKIWWPEMVGMRKNSSGEYDREPYKLGTCPFTNVLMYMPPIYYIQWIHFDERDSDITNSFKDYIDRLLLNQ